MICPFCGGPAVKNGSTRSVCKVCGKSFKKELGDTWKTIKNDVVHGTEHFSKDIEVEQLV
jgi:transposase-like protein